MNKIGIYTEQIKPLLKELGNICVVNDIPYFFSAAVEDTGTCTRYANKGNLPSDMGISLTDDRFGKYLAVSAGFDTIPKDSREDNVSQYIDRDENEDD